MLILSIRVTPLTRKILISEYGPEPIRFEKGDLLGDQLRTVRTRTGGYQPRTLQWLSARVAIVVNDELERIINGRNSNVGLALFNFHREVMLRYVEALYSVGVPARQAIYRFYEKHGIDEFDYSSETAYRRWVDYKEKKVNKGTKRTIPADLRKVEERLTPADNILLDAAEAIFQEIKAHQKKVSDRLQAQLRAYLLYKYAGHTLHRTGCLTGRSLDAVFRSVRAVEAQIARDKFLNRCIQTRVKTP